MPKTTKEVAEALGLKSRAVTTYAKKYGLLPEETFGGQPMWEGTHIHRLTEFKKDMDAGNLCKECGSYLPAESPAPAEEPGE